MPGGILGKGIEDPCVGKETLDGIAVKGYLAPLSLFAEEVLELQILHKVLEEEIADVEACGGGSGGICMGYTFVEISGKSIIDPADTVFLVPFPDFLPDIGFWVICDLQEFRMFPKIHYIFGCYFFPVSESLLTIISWIFQTFVKVKFHNNITSVLLYHKHATHATYKMKKFDKKIPHFCGLWRFYLIITVEDP